MRSLFQDIRYGWRMLLKKPGFTIVAALALALGQGDSSSGFLVEGVPDPQAIRDLIIAHRQKEGSLD